MMDCEGLSKIIGLIYEAGLKPDIWPSVLDRLADLLAATSGAAIISYDSRVRAAAMLFPRVDPEYVRSFLEYWSHGSLMLDYGRRSPTAAVVNREMFISREEYCRTAFFNEWCKPLRAEAFMGAKLLTEGSLSTFFGVVRPYASGDFDQAETRLFAVLVPHLQRALQVHLRVRGLDQPLEGSVEILNQLLCGILLVDAQAQVIFANRAAEKILRAGCGLLLERDGLRADIPHETQVLRRTIAHCAKPGGEFRRVGGCLRVSRENRSPLSVLVVPHCSGYSWIDVVRPRSIVFVSDPEDCAAAKCENLRADFGLTPAEAALALEISKADGLGAAANRLGVSLATAHTQLAHIFDKTGARRQAQLVRLLLQDRPPIAEEH